MKNLLRKFFRRRIPLPENIPPAAEFSAFVLLLGLFLLFTLRCFHSPGFIIDNLANEYKSAHFAEALRSGTFGLRDVLRQFHPPLYHGEMTTLLMLPFFYVWGRGFLLVKLWPIVAGGLTVLLAYFLARKMFSGRVALLSTFLLVLHPSFILGVKSGNFQVSYMILFSTGSVFLFFLWWTSHRTMYIFLGMVLVGLGIGTRMWFVWYVLALILCALLFFKELWSRGFFRQKKRLLLGSALGIAGFVLGGFFTLRTEIAEGRIWDAVHSRINKEAFAPAETVRSPRLALITARWEDLAGLLKGQTFFHLLFDRNIPRSMGNFLYPWLFWASFFFLLYSVVLRNNSRKKRTLFLLTLFLSMFVVTYLTPRSRFNYHMFLYYPFPQLLIALAVGEAAARLRPKSLLPRLFLLLFIAATFQETVALAYSLKHIKIFGGMRGFSDSLGDLHDWLMKNRGDKRFFIMPTAIHETLYLYYPDFSLEDSHHTDILRPAFSQQLIEISPWKRYFSDNESNAAIRHGSPEERVPCRKKLNEYISTANLWPSFVTTWSTVVSSSSFDKIVLVNSNSWSFTDQYFYYLLSWWGRCNGAPLRLARRFDDKDGTPSFLVYELPLKDRAIREKLPFD
ncbi:MAG TPA: glycosyltransferase family 39 protein [Elusimicrobiota bacterium]|nr:glycosyltransferase family 39 protein [Elusimicrobiota bacterium]